MGRYLSSLALNELIEQVKENSKLKPEQIKDLVLEMHPIGSYYWSSESTSPGQLFGGSWQSITDGRMLWASDNTNNIGAANASLSAANIPSHTHTYPSHTHTSASHTHNVAGHGHSVSISHKHDFTHGGHSTNNGAYQAPVLQLINRVSNNGDDAFEFVADYSTYTAEMSTGSARATVSLSGNAPTSVSTATVTGSTNSTNASSGGMLSYSGSSSKSNNGSLSLTPPYLNAYCWYRTG